MEYKGKLYDESLRNVDLNTDDKTLKRKIKIEMKKNYKYALHVMHVTNDVHALISLLFIGEKKWGDTNEVNSES